MCPLQKRTETCARKGKGSLLVYHIRWTSMETTRNSIKDKLGIEVKKMAKNLNGGCKWSISRMSLNIPERETQY